MVQSSFLMANFHGGTADAVRFSRGDGVQACKTPGYSLPVADATVGRVRDVRRWGRGRRDFAEGDEYPAGVVSTKVSRQSADGEFETQTPKLPKRLATAELNV